MKAVVFYGENDIRVEERDKPRITNPGDAIVKITKTTICGTDLGILKGKNPEIIDNAVKTEGAFNGRILGHEGIGIVEEVGTAVTNFKKGDKVIVSCISRCGTCENCQKQLYAHCRNNGGWILGYKIDGTQAEYVRTPYADNSLYHFPDDLDDDAGVMLSDALPTAHEIGIQSGAVQPGDTIAIVGAGPVGMSCILTGLLYSPSQVIVIDLDDNRLAMAKAMGATHCINSATEDAIQRVMEITGQRGVDCAIEAVGIESTWNICQEIVKEGGHLANVGVHGSAVTFSLEKLWIKNLTITTGLVNANTTGMLLKSCCAGKIAAEKMTTHHFNFKEIEKAYDVFKHAATEKAMKVVVSL